MAHKLDQTNTARAFRAVASRIRTSMERARNAEKRAALAAKLAATVANAEAAERGAYKPAPAPVTDRTAAALAAHRTRAATALERARNADRKRELAAAVRDYDQRIAALS